MGIVTPEGGKLTDRQFEVIELASKGLTNPEIASALGISRATVKVHLAAAYRALEVTNRTEAAALLVSLENNRNNDEMTNEAQRSVAVLPFEDLRGCSTGKCASRTPGRPF